MAFIEELKQSPRTSSV